MKAITVYSASDGERFDSEDKCIEYEALMAECQEISDMLPDPPSGMGSSIPVDREVMEAAWAKFTDLYNRIFKKEGEKRVDPTWHFASFIVRVVSDCGYPCLRKVYWKFHCINRDLAKMYDQPYYAQYGGKERG